MKIRLNYFVWGYGLDRARLWIWSCCHSPPSGATSKKKWNHTFTPSYAVMACTGIKLPLLILTLSFHLSLGILRGVQWSAFSCPVISLFFSSDHPFLVQWSAFSCPVLSLFCPMLSLFLSSDEPWRTQWRPSGTTKFIPELSNYQHFELNFTR